jgi:hypothetical protein
MRVLISAAIAVAGLAMMTAPAKADASNCTVWNGPFCETAHNIRHHGWQLPIVWEQPYPYWQQPWYQPHYPIGSVGYPLHQPYPRVSACTVPSVWSCRRRVPLHGGIYY